jgi:hypothetical protein
LAGRGWSFLAARQVPLEQRRARPIYISGSDRKHPDDYTVPEDIVVKQRGCGMQADQSISDPAA